MLNRLLLLLTLTFAVPFAMAQSDVTKEEKYAGIEITVNVNQASAQELADLLSGVGIKKAEAIIEYRKQNGDFKNADDLVNVKGIGSATLEKNRERIEL